MIVEPDFLDHWKTQLLIEELGGEPSAPLYVLRLWAHCQNRKTSRFNIPTKALKAICRFSGDADELLAALVESGFIQVEESGELFVLGWDERNSKLLANWENGQRGGRRKAKNKPNDNPRETQEEPNDNPTETHENPAVTDKSRVEKSREAEIRSDQKSLDDDVYDDEILVFDSVSGMEAAARLARALEKRRIPGIASEWIWEMANVGEALRPGLVADTASKIIERQIGKPKAYLEKTLRAECEERGLKLAQVRKQCPVRPTKQPA